jgi:hypothetical protein
MTDQPVTPPDSQPPVEDYWGTEEYSQWYLPDGIQYFQFKIMNEGDKSKFEKITNQDMIVNQDRSARLRYDQTAQRHALIKMSVTDWHLFKDGEIADFAPAILDKWLQVANPKLVEDLEFAIRMANPWMQSEMTEEEVQKEIDRLYEVLNQIRDREAGEAVSATK